MPWGGWVGLVRAPPKWLHGNNNCIVTVNYKRGRRIGTAWHHGFCAGHERPANDSGKERHTTAPIESYEVRQSHSQLQLVS